MAKSFPLNIYIRGIDLFTKPLANAANKLDRFGQKATRLGGQLTLGLTTPIALAGIQVLRTAGEMEKMQTSLLTAFQGNQQAADAASASIISFAKTTPYEVGEVLDAFIKLKNRGLDPSEDALRTYGNTASAMGKSLDQMIEAVADASTGEFERLKEFGIKANKQGKQVTFTFRGVKTKVKFEAAEIEKYLQRIGKVEFAGGMERQSRTLFGLLSNLKDNLDQTMASIGFALSKAINLPSLLIRLSDGLGRIKIAFEGLSPQTQKFLAWAAIAVMVLPPLVTMLGFMAIGIAALISPLGLALVGLAAVGAAFLWASVQLGSFADAFKGALVGIGDLIFQTLLSPLWLVTKALEGVMNLLNIGKNGGFAGAIRDTLRGISGLSLLQVPGVQGFLERSNESTPVPLLKDVSRSGISAAGANRFAPAKSEVSIVFKNQPAGMRVESDSDSRTNLSITQGLSMVTP